MFRTLHWKELPEALPLRRLLAWGALVCAAFGTLFAARPYVSFGIAIGVLILIAALLMQGSLPARLIMLLFQSIECLAIAWYVRTVFSTPPPGASVWNDLLYTVGIFFIWSGLFSLIIAATVVLIPGALGKNLSLKASIFRMFLYLEYAAAGSFAALLAHDDVAVPPQVIVIAILLILSNTGLTYAYKTYVSRSAEAKASAEALGAELEEQKTRFEAMSSDLMAVRRLRHDLNNHLTVIASLVRNGKRDEARTYMRDLRMGLEHKQGLPAEKFSMSLVRTRTAHLEERGVKVRYPNVQPLAPAQRALIWSWTSLIVSCAEHAIQPGPDAFLSFEYLPEPLIVNAWFRPADFAAARRYLRTHLLTEPVATVLTGYAREADAVLVSVLVHQ